MAEARHIFTYLSQTAEQPYSTQNKWHLMLDLKISLATSQWDELCKVGNATQGKHLCGTGVNCKHCKIAMCKIASCGRMLGPSTTMRNEKGQDIRGYCFFTHYNSKTECYVDKDRKEHPTRHATSSRYSAIIWGP